MKKTKIMIPVLMLLLVSVMISAFSGPTPVNYTVAAEDWPMMFHDHANNEYSSNTAPTSISDEVYSLDINESTNGPVIWGDYLYVGDARAVRQFNKTTGELVNQFDCGAFSGLAVVDGYLYYGSVGSVPYPADCVGKNVIFKLDANNISNMVAYSNITGDSTNENFVYSPVVYGDYVWVQADGDWSSPSSTDGLYKLNATDLSVIDHYNYAGNWYNQPIITENFVYASNYEDCTVFKFDVNDLSAPLLNTTVCGGSGGYAGVWRQMLFDGDNGILYVPDDYNPVVHLLNATDLSEIANFTPYAGAGYNEEVDMALDQDGYLYVLTLKNFYKLNATDMTPIINITMNFDYVQFSISDDYIFVQNKTSGFVVQFSKDDLSVLSSYFIGGGQYGAGTIFSDGYVYAVTSAGFGTNKLYKLGEVAGYCPNATQTISEDMNLTSYLSCGLSQLSIIDATLDCKGATLTRSSGADALIVLNDNATIKNCVFDDAEYNSVVVNSDNVLIRDNVWQDMSVNQTLISLGSGTNISVINNTFDNLTFVNPGTDVFILEANPGNDILVQDNYVNNIVLKDYDAPFVFANGDSYVNLIIDNNYVNDVYWPVDSDGGLAVIYISSKANNTKIINNHISNVTNDNRSSNGIVHLRNDNFDILVDNNTFADLEWYSDDNFIWYQTLNLEGIGINVTNNVFEDFNMYGADNYNNIININNAYNMIIDGNTFRKLYAPEGILNIGTADNITVSNNEFTEFSDQGGVLFGAGGSGVNLVIDSNNFSYVNTTIYSAQTNNLVVSNNRFENMHLNDDVDMFQINSGQSNIINNYVNNLDLDHNLFGAWDENNVLMDSNEVYNVNIYDSDFCGFLFQMGNNSNVTNNIVENVTRNAWPNSCGYAAVISPGGTSGYGSDSTSNYIISNNNITNADLRVFGGGQLAGILIENNRVFNSGGYNDIGFGGGALGMTAITNGVFRNNYFDDYGGFILASSGGDYGGNLLIENNYFKSPMNGNYDLGTYSYFNTGGIDQRNVTWNNNTIEITSTCIDPGNSTGNFCYLGVVAGCIMTNNRMVTNGYNVTWPFGLQINDRFLTDFDGCLVENNTGAFMFTSQMSYGSDVDAVVRNNNFSWNAFDHDMMTEWDSDYRLVYAYQSGGATNLTFIDNTYDVAGPVMYFRWATSGDDYVVFEGNDVIVQDELLFIDRYADQYDYLSLQDNNWNSPVVNFVPMAYGGNNVIPDNFELFDEASEIKIDVSSMRSWVGFVFGKEMDMNGYALSYINFSSGNDNINLTNFLLLNPGTDTGNNNIFRDYDLAYANITEFQDYSNTTNLVVNVPDLDVIDLVLEGQHGLIRWNHSINVSAFGDFDRIVDIGYNTITVNPETDDVNGTADLTFYATGYKALDKLGLKRNGNVVEKSSVSNFLVNGVTGDVSFRVPHFTTYTLYGLTSSFGGGGSVGSDIPVNVTEEEEVVEEVTLPVLGVVPTPTPTTTGIARFIDDFELVMSDTFARLGGLFWNPGAIVEQWGFTGIF